MQPAEIEAWTLRIIDQLLRGAPIEDTRVELKSNWLGPQSAARRIAGHANSARGATVLWIVGLDEKAGVVGAKGRDFATWWNQVQAEFNELAPSVIDLVVPFQGKEVVALVFDTSRAPFVVKNPLHGKSGGGSVSREVPWREGTSIRSATRTDLVTLLVPLLHMPTFEVLSGSLSVNQAGQSRSQHERSPVDRRDLRWHLRLDVYITVALNSVVVIPNHQCSGELNLESRGRISSFSGVRVASRETSGRNYPSIGGGGGIEAPPLRHTIQQGVNQLIVQGPGPARIFAEANTEDDATADFIDVPSVFIETKLRPVDAIVPVTVAAELTYVSDRKKYIHNGAIAEWQFSAL